jgi:hypothetical protein
MYTVPAEMRTARIAIAKSNDMRWLVWERGNRA